MCNSVTDPATLMILQCQQEEMEADFRRRELIIEQNKQLAAKDVQLTEKDKQIAHLRKLLEENGIDPD